MITTHSIADFRAALYGFLSSSSIEGFRQDPYFDSKGIATMEEKWGQTRFITDFLGLPLGSGRTRRWARAVTCSLNPSLPKTQALLVASRISARWELSKWSANRAR